MKFFLRVLATVVLCVCGIVWLQTSDNSEKKSFATIESKPLTSSFLAQDIPLIDIRTPREWRETGIIPKSYLATFYKEDNSFNEEEFLGMLSAIVNKDDTFVILCRTGNRSMKVANFLASQGYTHVVNLSGGIKEAFKNGIHASPYSGLN